ncbi:hypothetical protein EYF80_048953 [Liparis tanakae]|uniref:Uncharacterized protein n=1 Tax=Liparis tanakae TaxID=230148 RepID=A0A4Z2FIT9_9TELE|nr:hypothetical protein EYF80_048953 [Liparis tanakae]
MLSEAKPFASHRSSVPGFRGATAECSANKAEDVACSLQPERPRGRAEEAERSDPCRPVFAFDVTEVVMIYDAEKQRPRGY